MSDVFTYESFTPDAMLGEWKDTIDLDLQSRWNLLFDAQATDTPARAAGLTVACMMRAYLGVVSPRPPGNVHARQTLSIESPPKEGEVIHSRVWCRDKEMRKDRRYIYLEVTGTGDGGRPLYSGRMSLIWAA